MDLAGPVRILHKGITMPIGAINWNNSTKTLCLRGAGPLRGTTQYASFRKQSNNIFYDDSPICDESTRPWGVTHQNEIDIGKLTGNPAAKKAQLEAWGQQYIFDVIIPLSTLASDDPDKTVDPNAFERQFWGDEDGIQQAPFDHLIQRGTILVGFDETALGNDELLISIRVARVI